MVKKKTSYGKQKTVSVAGSSENSSKHEIRKNNSRNPQADAVVSSALEYAGVRYLYGGNTRKGMDCSGLIHVALKQNDITFPRVSRDMAKEGKSVTVKKIRKGDLLFFDTVVNGKRIDHVGLVVKVEGSSVNFIHSTSSRGVIVSSLREGYWNRAFVKATRIL